MTFDGPEYEAMACQVDAKSAICSLAIRDLSPLPKLEKLKIHSQ
jgi:hypothetical protein